MTRTLIAVVLLGTTFLSWKQIGLDEAAATAAIEARHPQVTLPTVATPEGCDKIEVTDQYGYFHSDSLLGGMYRVTNATLYSKSWDNGVTYSGWYCKGGWKRAQSGRYSYQYTDFVLTKYKYNPNNQQ